MLALPEGKAHLRSYGCSSSYCLYNGFVPRCVGILVLFFFCVPLSTRILVATAGMAAVPWHVLWHNHRMHIAYICTHIYTHTHIYVLFVCTYVYPPLVVVFFVRVAMLYCVFPLSRSDRLWEQNVVAANNHWKKSSRCLAQEMGKWERWREYKVTVTPACAQCLVFLLLFKQSHRWEEATQVILKCTI